MIMMRMTMYILLIKLELSKNELPLDDVEDVLIELLEDYTPYNLRALIRYCDSKNIEPSDLTKDELK